MADNISFTEEEMMVDEGTGYPKAYARLCGDGKFRLYYHGPPFTFLPYTLKPDQAAKMKEFDELFPIIDPKARPTTKPKLFVSLLWKQLSHIGSAGFDPAIFRVDTYGNVLYYHADSASPLAWDVDHWFPCSRGGLSVPSNLRILQKRVCKRKHNKLEFQLPWWDLQLGISVNQFLSIFASSNSDFRHRAFSFLFSEGENEELNDSQTVDSHMFPQHFVESQEQVGLAPAAIVLSRREAHGVSSTFKSLDYNWLPRPSSPMVAARKFKHDISKENDIPDMVTNPYEAIVMARDSLKQREETTKMLGEMQKLDDEVNEMRLRNENERMTIQELELMLIKRKRRVEKCRRLSEAQSSYRVMLEKMIRDAMHQSVIYKEQVRLNQAATNALMARLEAQKAICDASEKELHKKFNQRDEIEKQIRPEGEQARKRSRKDESSSSEENANQTVLSLPGPRPITPRPRHSLERREEETGLALKGSSKPSTPILRVDNKLIKERYDQARLSLEPSKLTMSAHKELREFLEEEQKASEAGLSLNEDRLREEEIVEEKIDTAEENINNTSLVDLDSGDAIEDELQKLVIGEGNKNLNSRIPAFEEPEKAVEDEESKRLRGKGHVEKWLHMLLENSRGQGDLDNKNYNENEGEEIEEVDKENVMQNIQGRYVEQKNRKNRAEAEKLDDCGKGKEDGGKGKAEKKFSAVEVKSSRKSFDGKERCEKGKEKGLLRSESARSLWPIPTSPSMILSVRKGVDRIRRRQ